MVGNLLRYRGVDASTSTVGVLDGEFVQTADDTTYSFPSGNGNSDWSRVGQGYTFGPNPSEIQGLVFRLKKTGTATGMLNAVITDTAYAPQVRSSTFVAADSISTSPTNYFFDLSGWTPTASTLYYILLETTDGLIDATNTVDFIVESGAEATDPDDLRAFQYVATSTNIGFDVAYKVYSVSGSASSPSSVVACTSATGTKLSEFVPAEDTSSNFVGDAHTSAFTTFNSGSATSISGVCLRLYKEGTPTGTFKVSIRASIDTGVVYKPTGADLAVTSAYDMSTVTGGGESFAADYWFALPFTPSPNTFYTIVVEEQGDFVGDGSNTMAWVIDGEPENATNGGYSTDYGASWVTYSTADGGHKVYGSAGPTEDPITSIDFGTRAVITISNTLSADETEALKVDVSQLLPEEGTGRPVREVYIEQIKAITSGVDVDILWDAASPEHCMTLTGNSGIDYDFRAVGPLTNNAGAGKTGDILFSTNGASAGSSYSVTLVMRKKY